MRLKSVCPSGSTTSISPFRENYDKTDQPINRLIDQLTDIRGDRKVTLQKSD